jgi:hypothetical protein
VKCEKSSSGKRLGTGGAKIGNVHLKWAFSEAAVLFLRANPPAQKFVEKLRKTWKGQVPFHPRPQARSGRLLHDEAEETLLARGVSYRLTGRSEASPSPNWSHSGIRPHDDADLRTVPSSTQHGVAVIRPGSPSA